MRGEGVSQRKLITNTEIKRLGKRWYKEKIANIDLDIHML